MIPGDLHRPYPALISFSGIDGAGKSTQIAALCDYLNRDGVSFRLIRFWDEVATLKRIREESSHVLFKGDKGVGSPEKPVHRRDKNVQTWYMALMRLGIYFLDALSLRHAVAANRRNGVQVLVFDRYVYDELANLPSPSLLYRKYVQMLLRLCPKPDIAYLLDADPVQACNRKPEYPLDFLTQNRASYLAMSEMSGMTVIPPLALEQVSESVIDELSKKLRVPYTGAGCARVSAESG